jgi:vacuolar-type H+-ATPase subunit H
MPTREACDRAARRIREARARKALPVEELKRQAKMRTDQALERGKKAAK